MTRPIKDLTGQRFGKLIALSVTEKRHNSGLVVWLCVCDCGNTTTVSSSNLVQSNTKSCGCLSKEQLHSLYFEGSSPSRLLSKKLNINNTSGVKGVSYHKARNKWAASIKFKRKKYHLGFYNTKEEAEKARKKAEEMLFEPFLERYNSLKNNKNNEEENNNG